MSFHLAAFYQSVTGAGTFTQLAAVPDQAIRTNGVDLVVPSGVANLLAEAALADTGTGALAQVQSPSLRQLANQDVQPVGTGAVFAGTPAFQFHGSSPRVLRSAESLNFAISATQAAAAADYGLVWLGDGPLAKTTGNIFTVHGTGSAKLAAGAWVNTPITFDDTLPAGTYNVVGFRAASPNMVAARLVLVGAAFRPGVIAVSTVGARDFPDFRMGRIGSFGSFDVNQPPTVECLGITDTAQDFTLDLIKTS